MKEPFAEEVVRTRYVCRKRMVLKDGRLDVVAKSLTWWNPLSLSNAVKLSWWTIGLIFMMVYLTSWIIFALVYYVIANSSDPKFPGFPNSTRYRGNACFDKVKSFPSALLFSVETQQTIGFGQRSIRDGCALGASVVTIHTLVGLVLSSVMTGLLLNKFTQVSYKHRHFFFSRRALIMHRGNNVYFAIRIGDGQGDKLRNAKVDAIIILPKVVTQEGEEIPNQPCEFTIGFQMNGTNKRIPILWPIIIVHKIDAASPLYNYTPATLAKSDIEIIVWVTGLSTDNGSYVQVRTSYIASEIVWGGKFAHTPVERTDAHVTAFYRAKTLNKIVRTYLPNISVKEMERQGLIVESEIPQQH